MTRIVVATSYGGPEAFALQPLRRPQPKSTQVVVDVRAAGELEVLMDKVFPLDKAADAHRYLLTGHAHGKVVLVP